MSVRDIHGDYKRAYIEEYEAYRRAGRDEDAERVAAVLREQYGHDVDDGAREHTAAEPPPEDTAVKPAKRTPRQPRKSAQG